jgi:hypothetical protein
MALSIKQRKNAFIKAGKKLENILATTDDKSLSGVEKTLHQIITRSPDHNPWFTVDFVTEALKGIEKILQPDVLDSWLSNYQISLKPNAFSKKVLVVMAGNIPFVGFHDFLCVLLSGHSFIGKLSSQDKELPVAFANLLTDIEPGFSEKIVFYDEPVKEFDAVIATGSNNSARYFDYYFGKYPHIIRHNRNSIAVLSGQETKEELKALAKDVFLYFGLGCRNISKIFVPNDYDFSILLDAFCEWEWVKDHSKYINNYDYQKAIFLVNRVDHFDNGFLIVTENALLSSPLSVLHYEKYSNIDQINNYLSSNRDSIQCVVASAHMHLGFDFVVLPGESQNPGPADYADGVDTLEFLIGLK